MNQKNKIQEYIVVSNKQIATETYEIILKGPTEWIKPGKFVSIKIPNKFLRRPMSVCKYDNDTLTIVYRVVGEGTKILSKIALGVKLDLIIDLGNSFKIESHDKVMVISSGCGIGSIYQVIQELNKKNIEFTTILSYRKCDFTFYIDEVKKMCKNVIVTTDDGSMGFKGNTVDAIKHYNLENHYYYICGSNRMMKAVATTCKNNGQVSLEARFGCGYGLCMGCSVQTKNGNKRICKEGPIFLGDDILWETID